MIVLENSPHLHEVLVIDDDEGILFTAKTVLESEGYLVHVAPSPQEGIEFYRQNWRTIELVVVDFLMPEMTGDEVVECLRHLNPEVRILVCAGWDDNVATRLSASNLQGFLEKPFALEELVRRVRDVVHAIQPTP